MYEFYNVPLIHNYNMYKISKQLCCSVAGDGRLGYPDDALPSMFDTSFYYNITETNITFLWLLNLISPLIFAINDITSVT